jgi:hypothetical protein
LTAKSQSNNYEPDGDIHGKEMDSALPKTAVFVGQCLVCENSPVLQGTWVVFPNAQSCILTEKRSSDSIDGEINSVRSPSVDTFLLLA